ncbi:MAG: hypothetical protein IT269_08965 [Saprospiraceae bacterium]|nr:hypothetical protein [Saprospiraceae bacterium]
MQRDFIFGQYPWLGAPSPQGVIIGDDLDAALSALIYLRHNPQARLVGIYAGYERLYLQHRVQPAHFQRCIFLDLDIYDAHCRSLGHHIVRQHAKDQLAGFGNSCNLNELAGRSVSSDFNRKYPLGTVHFLLWLYDLPLPANAMSEALMWMADSAFINGQSHRFRENVGEWISQQMPHPDLLDGFENKIDTPEFESTIEMLQEKLRLWGFQAGNGQVTSKHRQLSGFQCQPLKNMQPDEMSAYIIHLLNVLAEITGWEVPQHQVDIGQLCVHQGKRQSGGVGDLLQGHSLDAFLSRNQVFSYVFPYKNAINYTVF